MRPELSKLQEVEFKERPVVVGHQKPVDFEAIVVTDHQSNKEYCIQLLKKLVRSNGKFQKEFVLYHSVRVRDPVSWLQSLGKLIETNTDYFYAAKKQYLMLGYYGAISEELAKLQPVSILSKSNLKTCGQANPENPFDIEKTKKYLAGIKGIAKKKQKLRRLRIDYLQYKHKYASLDSVPFDEQIDMELNYLNIVEEFSKLEDFDAGRGQAIKKLTIQVPAVLVAMAFAALLQHRHQKSLKYLSVTPFQMAVFLANSLQYDNGKPLERKVLFQVIMSESKNTKRLYKRFKKSLVTSLIPSDVGYDFNFDNIKKTLESIASYGGRMIFLHRVLTNYLQHKVKAYVDTQFLNQIHLELAYEMAEYQNYNAPDFKEITPINRIIINGPVNVLMTFFYELLVEIPGATGLTIFSNTKRDIIYFVMRYFKQRNGKNLSRESLRTMLTPSKADKRCTVDKRVEIRAFIKFAEKKGSK